MAISSLMKSLNGCWSFPTPDEHVTSGSDVISSNPLLVDILSHLTPGDIRRCKHVSRQWNDVIRRHARSLPRGRIDLHITKTRSSQECEMLLIHISYRYRRTTFAITNNRIRMNKKGVPSIYHHYKRNGPKIGLFNRLHDMKLMQRYKRDYCWKREKNVDFAVSSLPEGLHDLLVCIFLKYEVNVFHFGDFDMPPECVSSIIGAFQSQNFKCTTIDVDREILNLELLYNAAGRNQLALRKKKTIDELLPRFSEWIVMCSMETEKQEDLLPFFKLIRSWTAGKASIKYIVVERWNTLAEKWDEDMINRELGRLPSFSTTHFPKHGDVELLFRRTMDSRQLRLFYAPREYYIEVHDSQFTQKPLVLLNQSWRPTHCCCGPPPENHDD